MGHPVDHGIRDGRIRRGELMTSTLNGASFWKQSEGDKLFHCLPLERLLLQRFLFGLRLIRRALQQKAGRLVPKLVGRSDVMRCHHAAALEVVQEHSHKRRQAAHKGPVAVEAHIVAS